MEADQEVDPDDPYYEPWGGFNNWAADRLGAFDWQGNRDTDGVPCRWRNHYECDCGVQWSNEWSCQCDDECLSCSTPHSPYHSDDLLPTMGA